jgi:hypothetical protein
MPVGVASFKFSISGAVTSTGRVSRPRSRAICAKPYTVAQAGRPSNSDQVGSIWASGLGRHDPGGSCGETLLEPSHQTTVSLRPRPVPGWTGCESPAALASPPSIDEPTNPRRGPCCSASCSSYDQAARTVACMAKALDQCPGRDTFKCVGFYVLAPLDQIERGVLAQQMTRQSIQDKITARIAAYSEAHPERDRPVDLGVQGRGRRVGPESRASSDRQGSRPSCARLPHASSGAGQRGRPAGHAALSRGHRGQQGGRLSCGPCRASTPGRRPPTWTGRPVRSGERVSRRANYHPRRWLPWAGLPKAVDVHLTSAPEAGHLRPGRAGSRGLSHEVSAHAAPRRPNGSLKSSSSAVEGVALGTGRE